jgi:FtsP/CotA-like multicopper oxidase with cupredoxin domain
MFLTIRVEDLNTFDSNSYFKSLISDWLLLIPTPTDEFLGGWFKPGIVTALRAGFPIPAEVLTMSSPRADAATSLISSPPDQRHRRTAVAWSAALALLGFSSLATAGTGSACLDAPPPAAGTACQNPIGTYYANSPLLRKFIDTLPGLTNAGANRFADPAKPGEYIPLATPDTSSFPGSDYYTLAVVEYSQWMHSDLQKPTTLRGYVQIYPEGMAPAGAFALAYPDGSPIVWPGTSHRVWAADRPHYLGPVIVASRGRAVRIKMINLLPTGAASFDINGQVLARNGDIMLPVDESLPGAGLTPSADRYPQNRVAIHLHGGDSPWISDGTPHQWYTAVGDTTPYQRGDRQFNVPDMPYPGLGAETLFYPNEQSSRLMWYHDHAFGLTRQNAYAGMAAGYLIVDPVEDAALASALPAGTEMLPLIIQDKGFVPSDIAVQDAKWNTAAWGQPGDLWFPHVYEPNVVAGASGQLVASPAGRWDWGPTMGDSFAPALLPLPDGSYGQASATPESYMDTAMVNGVAYPTVTVEPKAYRVRMLNGANDRYFNLSLYVADPSVVSADGRGNTEVRMIPEVLADGTPGRPEGIPDPATAGPAIVQFGNEAGLLPAPVVHRPAAIQLTADGSVASGGLYLANAERIDSVIDFSAYAGRTLILYNDSTAPVPSGDARYDYFTGNPDRRSEGGAPSTRVGYGPNTRTIMQIVVAPTLTGGAPAPAPYDPAGNGGALATVLPAAYALVADSRILPAIDVAAQLQVDTVANTMSYPEANGVTVTVPLQVKTIEGGNDPNFGRLIANFGTEVTQQLLATPLAYIDPATEVVSPGQPQFWLIKNNDADNHPIHFHLFNVQVVARVSQTIPPMVRAPEADEAGWKETVKNWPGENLIVALRPKTPQLPFGLANSRRLLDPTLAAGTTTNTALAYPNGVTPPLAFTQYDLTTGAPVASPVANTTADFGWEYVWHCHILGHEENDLMRPLIFRPVITAPNAPTALSVSPGGRVSWTDATPALDPATKGHSGNEIGFRVERATVAAGLVSAYTALPAASPLMMSTVNTLANETSMQDSPAPFTDYRYRVIAINEAGEAASAPVTLSQGPAAPTGLTATASANGSSVSVTLAWTDRAGNETGYQVLRGGTLIATLPAEASTHTDDTAAAATTYGYTVRAVNGAGASTDVVVTVTTPAVAITAPTLRAFGAVSRSTAGIQWASTGATTTGYEVQVCVGTGAYCALSVATWTPMATLVGANKTSWSSNMLRTRTNYSFRVRALNAVAPALNSTWSKTLTLLTQ